MVVNSSNSSVMAGIVTFNPEVSRLQENIESIKDQVAEVYLFDNCSDNIEDVESVCSRYNVNYSVAKKNIGLGNALNAVMFYASDRGYQYAYLLDQDSVTSPGAISSQLSNTADDVAIVSPIIVDRNKPQRNIQTTSKVVDVRRPITSGSLVQTKVWYEVGGFDGAMFIDYIDYEFDERCLRNGYRLVEDGLVSLLQEGGHAELSPLVSGVMYQDGRLVFKHPYRYNYSVDRLYMRYRNATIFIQKYSDDRKFVMVEMGRLLKNLIHDVFVERDGLANYKAIVRGIKDGLAEKSRC